MIILWLKSRWPPLTEEKQGLHFMAFPLTCSSLSSALLFALSQTSQILSNEALSSLRCKFRAQPKWNKWLLLYKVTSPSWVTHSHITEKMSRFIERQWLFGSFCHWLAPHPISHLGWSVPKFPRTPIIAKAEATSSLCIMGNERGVARSYAAASALSEWISATCQHRV